MAEIKEKELLVSIRCITYNHVHFLRQCLDGFVMQKTNFRFEAIVHDDASTDGTTEILREYAEKYPDIIKPMYEIENQYSKGNGILRDKINAQLEGKYIAICEGDDYWTDPHKLQKQVDFLESHPEYAVCTHQCQIYLQEDEKFGNVLPEGIHENVDFDLNSYIQRKVWLTQPLTTVYRRSAMDLETYTKYKNSKDLTLFYHLLKSGKGRFMDDCMAVYRIHSGGVWSGASQCQQYFSDMKTYLGIYDVEQDETAALALKYWFKSIGYFGPTFVRKHWRTYLRVLQILQHHFGLFPTLKLALRSLNHFHAHFGY